MSSSPPSFAIDRTLVSEEAVRVQVRGELDMSTSPKLGEALVRDITDGRSVVVDLSKVTFIDSTGLNALVVAMRACEENGGALALSAELPAQVSRVFQITGLDSLFPIASQ